MARSPIVAVCHQLAKIGYGAAVASYPGGGRYLISFGKEPAGIPDTLARSLPPFSAVRRALVH